MHDTAYLATTYWKRIHNYLGTLEGSVLNVHRSGGFGILFDYLYLGEGFFAGVADTKTAVTRRAADGSEEVNQFWQRSKSSNHRLADCDRLFDHLCCSPSTFSKKQVYAIRRNCRPQSLLQCTEEPGEAHVGCSNNSVYSHNYTHRNEPHLTSTVCSLCPRTNYTIGVGSSYPVHVLVHGDNQYGGAARRASRIWNLNTAMCFRHTCCY